jgi:DNA primase
MIPDDIVERVRLEADPVTIIGEFVKLKRSGSSFRGPCPFHGGTHPNFSVSPKGGYTCFVCGEKGDVFTFVQKRLGLDFVETVKWVGAKAGVEVREVSRRAEGVDPREPMWELNTTVADYFKTQLWEAESGKAARAYLASRGIDRAAADQFTLGFAPPDPAAMRGYLTGLGFGDDRQLAGGLLVQTEDRPVPRPRFRNRLIFPITDVAGHVVGFGGRNFGDGALPPKYLNSAESELFAKRQILYGLHRARNAIRRAERVFIVEGYFDVIRLMLAGIEEAVAPLGTALTEAQAGLIRKYAGTAYLLYDSDTAGLKATFRSGDVLLATGVSVRVVSLPGGEDPDTFVAKSGAQGLERAVEQSVDIFDRKVQILERAGYFADLRKKREALDKLLPTIRVTSDPLTRELYLSRTSEVAGVSRDVVERELANVPATPAQPTAPAERPRPARKHSSAGGGMRRPGPRFERELVRAMLHQRRFVDGVAEQLHEDSFQDVAYRQIFSALVREGADASVEELARVMDEVTLGVLQELLEETGGLDRADELVVGSVNALLARPIGVHLDELQRDLTTAEGEDANAVIREKERLRDELTGLRRPRWKGFNSPR